MCTSPPPSLFHGKHGLFHVTVMIGRVHWYCGWETDWSNLAMVGLDEEHDLNTITEKDKTSNIVSSSTSIYTLGKRM